MLCKRQVQDDSHSLIHKMDNLEIVNIRAIVQAFNEMLRKCEMNARGQTNFMRHLSYATNLGFYKSVTNISTKVAQL